MRVAGLGPVIESELYYQYKKKKEEEMKKQKNNKKKRSRGGEGEGHCLPACH